MRRSMRRISVVCLYCEKSWPVCARSSTQSFFSDAVAQPAARPACAPVEGMARVGQQLRGHLGRRQHVVDQAGGDGAARHAVVLGRFGRLRDHHAAFALDRAQPSVPSLPVPESTMQIARSCWACGQRAEEEVDRQPRPALRRRAEQVQRAVRQRQVAVGRDDVGAVAAARACRPRPRTPVIARVAPDQLGQDALVVGRQVLHQDESHAGGVVGRQRGEEGLEGGEAARRRADADDGERG